MTRRHLRIQIFKLLFRVEFNQPEEMPEQMALFFDTAETIDEDAQAEIDKYKATPAGKRFIDAQQAAKAFCYKHSKGGMTWSEMKYYFNLCASGTGVLETINYAYCTAYRRGFNTAKRKAKKC